MNYYPHSTRKALVVTVFMGLLGIFSFWFNVADWQSALPLAIFYAVISLNTFFSVRCFASITPPDNKWQWAMDTCLVFFYILMALNMDNPLKFTLWATILFSIAVLKYAHLLSLVNYFKLLKYKIIVDGLGTLSCALALSGVIFGYPMVAVWAWTIIFVLANIYIFFIRPLYELPK